MKDPEPIELPEGFDFALPTDQLNDGRLRYPTPEALIAAFEDVVRAAIHPGAVIYASPATRAALTRFWHTLPPLE